VEILFIAPEIVPYSHTGEIGEVCAALPKALRSIGHKVTVVSPLWSGVEAAARTLARRLSTVEVQLGSEKLTCTLFDGRTTGGVDLVFVSQTELFGGAAGPQDSADGLRSALGFAQAAAAIAGSRAPTPEIVHAHGWFAAAMAAPLPASSLVMGWRRARAMPAVLGSQCTRLTAIYASRTHAVAAQHGNVAPFRPNEFAVTVRRASRSRR
jgi:starch synthase